MMREACFLTAREDMQMWKKEERVGSRCLYSSWSGSEES